MLPWSLQIDKVFMKQNFITITMSHWHGTCGLVLLPGGGVQ